MNIDDLTRRTRTLLASAAVGVLTLRVAVPATASGGSVAAAGQAEADAPDRHEDDSLLDLNFLGLGDDSDDGSDLLGLGSDDGDRRDRDEEDILGLGSDERGERDRDSDAGILSLGGDDLEAELEGLNRSGDEGTAEIHVHEDDRTVTVRVHTEGASPGLPHAQHIHIGGSNVCPGPSADTDDDGIIDTAEGQPSYGGIKVSLTTRGDVSAASALAVDRFPVADEDGTIEYSRTFELPEGVSMEEIERGVIVQHGVSELFADPAAYDGSPRASVNPALPLEAVAPSSCGELEEGDGLLGLSILDLDGDSTDHRGTQDESILDPDDNDRDNRRDGSILDLGDDSADHRGTRDEAILDPGDNDRDDGSASASGDATVDPDEESEAHADARTRQQDDRDGGPLDLGSDGTDDSGLLGL